ncbi:hypothetical protein QAD02_020268 [Eretmocerus hayati]|uniref:Uncharacterized protein n=1 Tax=Eretmocerus hayati TaxID=131215 RepID=A0ACC2PNU4_9HYME|nr:hypothetical protein QAD02_020268 [Eretmocerus hayati]
MSWANHKKEHTYQNRSKVNSRRKRHFEPLHELSDLKSSTVGHENYERKSTTVQYPRDDRLSYLQDTVYSKVQAHTPAQNQNSSAVDPVERALQSINVFPVEKYRDIDATESNNGWKSSSSLPKIGRSLKSILFGDCISFFIIHFSPLSIESKLSSSGIVLSRIFIQLVDMNRLI